MPGAVKPVTPDLRPGADDVRALARPAPGPPRRWAPPGRPSGGGPRPPDPLTRLGGGRPTGGADAASTGRARPRTLATRTSRPPRVGRFRGSPPGPARPGRRAGVAPPAPSRAGGRAGGAGTGA